MSNPHIIPDVSGVVSVISDLHKYSGVSNFSNDDRSGDPARNKARREEVFETFSHSDYVVFNGDIFDIQCAVEPAKKIGEAVTWLKERIAASPNTQFHFVLGNHEAFLPFIQAMEKLEQDNPQFHFHEHYLKLGDSLFVHGDEVLGVANYVKKYKKDEELSIEKNEGKRRRELTELSRFERAAYEKFNALYHKMMNKWRSLDAIIKTIYDGLQASDLEGLADAFRSSKHVFTGHTHEAYSASYKGKEFYNTGAAIASKWAIFRALAFRMDNGVAANIQPLLQADRQTEHTRPAPIITLENKRRVAVVSDLHLFGHTTQCDEALMLELNKAFSNANMIVLNGDIFDLTYPKESTEISAKNAVEWLRKFMETHAEKEVHFVLGNHEAYQPFIEEMKALEKKYKDFHFDEHFYQPAPKIAFVHGDEHLYKYFCPRPVYKTPAEAQAGGVAQLANYRLESIIQTLIVDRWRHPNKLRLSIRNTPGLKKDDLENIFMGHTHVPFVDKWVGGREEGYWVTNTGSATNPFRFTGCVFDMDSETGIITKPEVIAIEKNKGMVRVY